MTSDSTVELTELSLSDSDEDSVSGYAGLAKSVFVLQTLINRVKRQVLGRENVIELAVIALIADGHILLEDYPGSGKTTLAKALGEAIIAGSNTDESIALFRRRDDLWVHQEVEYLVFVVECDTMRHVELLRQIMSKIFGRQVEAPTHP